MEKATFGAGCFWGPDLTFSQIPGVVSTRVGYAGGDKPNPTYQEVCTDETRHAEVVEVTFEPARISYPQLLDAFWNMHNPTQVNRQGPDVGMQYRTVIFYHTPEQERQARRSLEKLQQSGKYQQPIATQILPAPTFWPAEEYHQKYLAKRGMGSCHI